MLIDLITYQRTYLLHLLISYTRVYNADPLTWKMCKQDTHNFMPISLVVGLHILRSSSS